MIVAVFDEQCVFMNLQENKENVCGNKKGDKRIFFHGYSFFEI
jgi:hypothetical protein